MDLLIINGVNLNMLGIREPSLYGTSSYEALVEHIKAVAKSYEHRVEIYQSNFEGEIVEKIQSAYKKFDGIIINAGAYAHTSIAILDALKAVNIRTVEVHLTDISKREDFRQHSYISLYAEACFSGEGFLSYNKAIEYFAK
ncbi:MAG: type II 3-dehydroquinate dehydratase [Clostridia bacterium]